MDRAEGLLVAATRRPKGRRPMNPTHFIPQPNANSNASAFAPARGVPSRMPPVATNAVTAIPPADRVPLPCSIGFLREGCVDDERVFICFASTEPGSASPWHDHGESTTYVLMIKGEGVVEFGPGEDQRVRLRADGTVYVVPPGLRHREVNTGTTENQAFVVRVRPVAHQSEAP